MIQIVDRKTYETIRESLKDGAGVALKGAKQGAETAWKEAKRVEWRMPWVYRKESSSRPWVMGLAVFGAVLGIIGGILYLRKRKQIANRYNMGDAEASGTYASSSAKDSETLATVSPGIN